MPTRFEYAGVRQKIIDMLKIDLMGPSSETEVLTEKPGNAYITGFLVPQSSPAACGTAVIEQEIDTDIAYDEEDYTEGEEDDNEPVALSHAKKPSSIGISFYVQSNTPSINIEVSWGDYSQTIEQTTAEDGTSKNKAKYPRIPMAETIPVDFTQFTKSYDYALTCDSNVHLHISRIKLKRGYSLVTAYIINQRTNSANETEATMFQVKIKASSADNIPIFLAEHICRDVLAADEFYFVQRPIMGHGRGCAATWGPVENGKTAYVESAFIPEYEFPGVSAALPGLDKFYFSMRDLSKTTGKAKILEKLNVLADSYEKWIQTELVNNTNMADPAFKSAIGDTVVAKCNTALARIHEGINLIDKDVISFKAFCFMNQAMLLQKNITNYARKHGAGITCNFKDFVDTTKDANNFGWRPFQIAFILMNLCGIVDPNHPNREVVDLLYFPTGGGKTEAYLGLMAFVIANRRLRANTDDNYNRVGGVTAILRYTLRLLTTQQRDRITKMVIAAEMIREREQELYGHEPISIGFWVGGDVTPNHFDDLKEDPANFDQTKRARHQKHLLFKQLLRCPFCGNKLTEDDFYIDTDTKSVTIYCNDNTCYFYKYNEENNLPRHNIPVYMVDEEIYAKCPTIILSTVDKFANLPWSVSTNSLFGRVDRKCSRHGYVAIGESHSKHQKTENLPKSELTKIKPFLPPELIIQDELHLITGPLGTIYGAYETEIEELCSYTAGDKKI